MFIAHIYELFYKWMNNFLYVLPTFVSFVGLAHTLSKDFKTVEIKTLNNFFKSYIFNFKQLKKYKACKRVLDLR